MSDNGHIDLGEGEGSVDAFPYFMVYPGDVGKLAGRTATPQFQQRRPACVTQFSTSRIVLNVSNAGLVMSDLVTLSYQIIFCTASGHRLADAWTAIHADEVESTQEEEYQSISAIPPQGAIGYGIEFDNIGMSSYLCNIYFRARVQTLWEPDLPISQWDFATDPRVTEAYLRVQ